MFFVDNTQKRNNWRLAVSKIRQQSVEVPQVPVLEICKRPQSKFVKWETTVNKEHIPAIEKNILTENLELLRQLEENRPKVSPKNRWKALIKKAKANNCVMAKNEQEPDRGQLQEEDGAGGKANLRNKWKCIIKKAKKEQELGKF